LTAGDLLVFIELFAFIEKILFNLYQFCLRTAMMFVFLIILVVSDCPDLIGNSIKISFFS